VCSPSFCEWAQRKTVARGSQGIEEHHEHHKRQRFFFSRPVQKLDLLTVLVRRPISL
jgi:hypothetical protein